MTVVEFPTPVNRNGDSSGAECLDFLRRVFVVATVHERPLGVSCGIGGFEGLTCCRPLIFMGIGHGAAKSHPLAALQVLERLGQVTVGCCVAPAHHISKDRLPIDGRQRIRDPFESDWPCHRDSGDALRSHSAGSLNDGRCTLIALIPPSKQGLKPTRRPPAPTTEVIDVPPRIKN